MRSMLLVLGILGVCGLSIYIVMALRSWLYIRKERRTIRLHNERIKQRLNNDLFHKKSQGLLELGRKLAEDERQDQKELIKEAVREVWEES